MTPQELKENLKHEYNILDFIDLGELSTNITEAHKRFKAVWRDEFNNNDRIVIYTEHEISNELLQHIYDTVSFIDIGAWFILICTPHNITEQLAQFADQTFQNLVVDIKNTQNLRTTYKLPDTICAIPWNNLEIKNNGDITPCCFSVKNSQIGNIKTDRLIDVFNGSQMQALRNDLMTGVQNPTCEQCWQREKQGLTSIRQHNIKRLRDDFLNCLLNEPHIANLDIKFNNTCNFKCTICSPGSSSLRAEEDHKFKGIPLIQTDHWPDSDNFAEQLEELLPTINNLDMYGGEPFLTKKFSRVLKTAVERGYAKNIRLHYNSNGSIWPGFLVEHWSHFKQVDIHFSIDAIGPRFEYQRGGVWEEVEGNILRIKALGLPNLSISLMPSISILSIYYIDEVLAWGEKHGFPIFFSHVKNPLGLSLDSLTQGAKDLIIKKYQNSNCPEIQSILDSFKTTVSADGTKFYNTINYFDRNRKTNFADHHKEIANAMNYVYTN
jgi:radical SAM protein with 4Fe4S-binding SPASM domain